MPVQIVAGVRLVKSLNRALQRILYNYYYEPDCDLTVLYTHWVTGRGKRTALLKCIAKIYRFLKEEAPKYVEVKEIEEGVEIRDGRDRRVTYPSKEDARKDVPMYQTGLKILREIAEIINTEEVE